MCGLFGAIGKKNKGGLSIPKIKILGLYNMSRGKDSCGYYYNNTLKKGVFYEKTFDSFIERNVLAEFPAKNNVFIGHTRSATGNTSHTQDNAHPFNVSDRLILAHNGTIGNIWELCRKYEVDATKIDVDSLALATLIDKVGFSILNEYVGYAALLFHKTEEPNSLYVYHGASKEYRADPMLSEERPLFYMDTREAVYFSSLENALNAIKDSDVEKPSKVGHNQVFKFVDGILSDEVFKVEREENNVSTPKKIYTSQNSSVGTNSSIKKSTVVDNRFVNYVAGLKSSTKKEDDENVPFILSQESKPERCFWEHFFEKEEEFVFYHKNRYYSTGGSDLLDGEFHIDDKGFIFDKPTTETIPYYFYRGVRLHNKNSFEILNKLLDDENSFLAQASIRNFAKEISKYSPYHVTNVGLEAENMGDTIKNVFYIGGELATKAIQPKFSERSYIFKNGELIKIHPVSKTDVTTFDASAGETEYINNAEKKEEKLAVIKPLRSNLVYPEMVETYKKYFTKVYEHPDEIYGLPSVVMSSIQFYVAEANGLSMIDLSKKDDIEKVMFECSQFVTNCINEKKSIGDLMINGENDYSRYIDDALIEKHCADYKKDFENITAVKTSGDTKIIRIDDNKQLTY